MHYYPLKEHQVFNIYPLYCQSLLSSSLIFSTRWDVWVRGIAVNFQQSGKLASYRDLVTTPAEPLQASMGNPHKMHCPGTWAGYLLLKHPRRAQSAQEAAHGWPKTRAFLQMENLTHKPALA